MDRKTNLDSILGEIGYVGRTQNFYFFLICFITFFTGSFTVIYAFTAGDLNYRCFIDECDISDSVEYQPNWLQHAVPFDKDKDRPDQCFRYEFIKIQNKSRDQCDLLDFNNKKTIKCDKFVFETEEQTILTEFNLTCVENKWKLTLPGTIHSSGVFFNMLIIGYFSDRFGRKPVFVASALIASIVAITQTFAIDYWWFVALKFLETCLGGGTYFCAVILSLELVSTEYRTAVGSLTFALTAFGKIYLGLTAMWLLNWKTLTLINYIPNLIAISYIWLLPESIKWLQVKERYQDIANILLRIIKWNKIQVSSDTHDTLLNRPNDMHETIVDSKTTQIVPIGDIFRSPPMMFRIISLAFCWLINLFIFYGLTLISVTIGGNKFTDFIIVNAVEIPACLLLALLSKRVGRKIILCTAFFVTAASLLGSTFVSDIYWIKLILFVVGKFSISMSFCIIFIYTSEMVPTCLRHTIIGVCSAFGRIGSLTAPQAPLLESVAKNMPIYLFAAFALAGGLISFRFPETLNCKLPNTIEEALEIGKQSKKSDS